MDPSTSKGGTIVLPLPRLTPVPPGGGGTLVLAGGVPQCHVGKHPRAGVPVWPGQDWGTPSQDRTGVSPVMTWVPLTRTVVIPPAGTGVSPPPPKPGLGFLPRTRLPPPPQQRRQNSRASSCYAAGGMPLAATQEDFLVRDRCISPQS